VYHWQKLGTGENMPALEYQVALVTGGGSGIGLGIVKRFVAEGARVMVLERVPERVTELESEFGGSVKAIQGDVTRLADNQRAVSEAVSAFGKLDIFIANAGVFDRFRRLDEIDDEILESAFDELFAVNVKGCFLGAKAALPELIKTQGSMTFTASGAGLNSLGGGTIYTASKHAVVGLVRQLAVESAPQVRVNAVAPGGVMTDLRGLESMDQAGESQFSQPGFDQRLSNNNPMEMAMQPEDLAGAYVYLSSRTDARAITGTILQVDAGSNLRWMRR
jgi:NAD(P)-dependent dehydrogenase (short-subunit alcohol dehydrogenase family)|tara:strand:+ start:506 stop:1336 length:831 start_codon:yes stop_codon:yes gene_type:complete